MENRYFYNSDRFNWLLLRCLTIMATAPTTKEFKKQLKLATSSAVNLLLEMPEEPGSVLSDAAERLAKLIFQFNVKLTWGEFELMSDVLQDFYHRYAEVLSDLEDLYPGGPGLLAGADVENLDDVVMRGIRHLNDLAWDNRQL